MEKTARSLLKSLHQVNGSVQGCPSSGDKGLTRHGPIAMRSFCNLRTNRINLRGCQAPPFVRPLPGKTALVLWMTSFDYRSLFVGVRLRALDLRQRAIETFKEG